MNLLHQKSPLFLIMIAFLFQTACGASPILHHENAEEVLASEEFETEENEADAGACPIDFPKAGFCASLEWKSSLRANQLLSVGLKFWKKTGGSPVGPFATPPKIPFLLLWMKSMNHGSSPVTLTPKTDANGAALPGQYESKNVFFVMPGPWEVHVQLKDGSTVVEEAVVPVKI